jgi:hypothetical protein
VSGNVRELPPKQDQAALLAAMGRKQTEIAMELSVSTLTIRRWAKQPDFQATVNRHREAVMASARDKARGLLDKSLQGLEELLDDEDKSIRLRACALVLSRVPLFSTDSLSGIERQDATLLTREQWEREREASAEGYLQRAFAAFDAALDEEFGAVEAEAEA